MRAHVRHDYVSWFNQLYHRLSAVSLEKPSSLLWLISSEFQLGEVNESKDIISKYSFGFLESLLDYSKSFSWQKCALISLDLNFMGRLVGFQRNESKCTMWKMNVTCLSAFVTYRSNTRRTDLHDNAVDKLQRKQSSVQAPQVKFVLHHLVDCFTFILKCLREGHQTH